MSNVLSKEARTPSREPLCYEDARCYPQRLYGRVRNSTVPARNQVLESFERPGKRHQRQQGDESMPWVAKAEHSTKRGKCGQPFKVGWCCGNRTQANW
jgi:hypothetical protein